jgi:hypothetical protein
VSGSAWSSFTRSRRSTGCGGDEQVGLSGDALFGFEPLGPFVAGLRVAVLDGPDRVHAHRDRGSQRSVLSGSGLDHVSGIGVDGDGDFTSSQGRLGGDPIVGPDEIGGAEVGVCVEQFGKLVDRVGELILRRGADRQMVEGDALGDLQLRARAGCVAARTVPRVLRRLRRCPYRQGCPCRRGRRGRR